MTKCLQTSHPIHAKHMQLGKSVDQSDLSRVFEKDDILTFWLAISGKSGGDYHSGPLKIYEIM